MNSAAAGAVVMGGWTTNWCRRAKSGEKIDKQLGSIYDFGLLLLLSSAPIPNSQTSIRAFVPLDFPRDGVLLVACSLLSRPDCGAFCAHNISDGEHNSRRDCTARNRTTVIHE